jgi:ornithine lipid ester-linked acyl 2-hydroxylase
MLTGIFLFVLLQKPFHCLSASATPRLWFSFFGGEYTEAITYYDKSRFDWTHLLESNWPVIKEEMEEFLEKNRHRLVPYFNKEMVSAPKKWKALSFMFWTLRFTENASQCPRTMTLLQQVPGIVSASISLLEPHTQIKPHRGDTNGIIRCHLGLAVPASLPHSGFQAGDEQRSWEEGRLLLFNDAARHHAWNDTDRIRVILLLDVIRPEFISKKNFICRTVLAALLWQYLSQKMKFLRSSPRAIKLAAHAVLKCVVAVVLPFRR